MRWVALTAALVFVAITAAAAMAASSVFNWRNVNERPYRGTAEAALKALVSRGLPQDAARDIAERARRGQFTTGTLQKGEQCRAMVLGIGTVEENVIMDWRHFAALETEDYETGEWLVRKATICNNWLLCKKSAAKPAAVPVPPAAVPTPPVIAVQPPVPPVSPPREVLALAEPEEAVTYNIWLWRYGPLTARFGRVSGHQSRDLGDLVLTRYFNSLAKNVPDLNDPKLDGSGCRRFLVVFKNFDYEAIRRDGIEISNQAGRRFANFGTTVEGGRVVNTIEVTVCNGRGFFRIKDNWVKTNSGLVVHAPNGPVFYYPTSGRLTKCTGEPNDEGRCGLNWTGPGEVHRNVVGVRRGEVKQGNIDAHFVLAE